MIFSYRQTREITIVANAVKKTVSLPPDLAKEAEEIARAEGKTLSAVIQDALRLARAKRLTEEFHAVQDYWRGKARDKGILTDEDLERYLKR
jgi:Arc/MetJ-type ribon-helix-helix transcriptional regulator